jgi:hypothetical protein
MTNRPALAHFLRRAAAALAAPDPEPAPAPASAPTARKPEARDDA